MLLCVLACWCYLPPMWLAAVMALPLVVDGFLQLLTRYESTNFRRAVTGILFGYGFAAMLIGSALAVFRFGYRLGQQL